MQDKLEDVSKKGQPVDIFPYVCRETLDAMLKCSLSYEGNMQEVEEYVYTIVWLDLTITIFDIEYLITVRRNFSGFCLIIAAER